MSNCAILIGPMRFLAGLLLVLPVFAQRTVSVPVSRSVSLRLDQVTAEIYVTAAASASIDDVVEALSGAGVTRADMRALSSFRLGFTHQFQISRPAQQFGEILFGLKQIADRRPVWMSNLDFALGLSVSQGQSDEVRRQLLPVLEREARAAAERIAKPMGGRVGAMLSAEPPMIPTIYDPTSGSPSPPIRPPFPSNNSIHVQLQFVFLLE